MNKSLENIKETLRYNFKMFHNINDWEDDNHLAIDDAFKIADAEIDQLKARIEELENILKELIRLDDCDSQCTDWKCSKSCQARTELISRARKILQ